MSVPSSCKAILQRITELVEAPPLVHLIDHYLDQLEEAQEDKGRPRW